jgi:hypothetical protein
MLYKITVRCYDNCYSTADIDYAKPCEFTCQGVAKDHDWFKDVFESDEDLRQFIIDDDVKSLTSEINNFTDLKIKED